MRWARACARRLFGRSSIVEGEEIVHELGSVLQQAGQNDAVKSALIYAVRRLTGARSVRWVQDPSTTNVPRAGEREVMVRARQHCRGRLLIEPNTNETAEWSPVTSRRLETLCTMAAWALGGCDEDEHCGTSPGQRVSPNRLDNRITLARAYGPDEERGVRALSTPVLQDATFLGAVLPFALSQARRHGEPLALLCVAIDRLNGIRELLGSEVSNRAVHNVGTHLAAELRSSDIIARIDDDRIIVVLPHARIRGAMFVARKICRSVETTPSLLPELPCLTVSIGVVECSFSTDSVDALLDAADAALAQAKTQGKNRAVAAPTLPPTERRDRSCLAG